MIHTLQILAAHNCALGWAVLSLVLLPTDKCILTLLKYHIDVFYIHPSSALAF